MFLSELSVEEKQHFLELASLGMLANGEKKESELEIFSHFQVECELQEYKLKNLSIKEISSYFLTTSCPRVRRIALIELIGVLIADGALCDKEQQFVDTFLEDWDISPAQFRRMKRWICDCRDLMVDGYSLIDVSE